MKEPPENVKVRLLYILHRAFVELRLLAQAGRTQQLFDLADAVENILRLLANWEDSGLDAIRFNLSTYESKYARARFDYTAFLDKFDIPKWV